MKYLALFALLAVAAFAGEHDELISMINDIEHALAKGFESGLY